jgi:hypothetical protein
MRRWREHALTIVMAAVALTAGGCQLMRPWTIGGTTAPVVFSSTRPTRDAIIEQLAANAQRIDQIEASVRVALDGSPPLAGTLVVEMPRRLRLKAGLLGMTDGGIDVGSNDAEFWLWSKSSLGAAEPVILWSRHDEFDHSPLAGQLRLRPQWIIDALGFMELPAAESITGPFPRADGRQELRIVEPMGNETLTRIIVVDSRRGYVLQQSLYDTSGRLIAYANSLKHQYFPDHQVSLPRHIEITALPAQGPPIELTVSLTSISINALQIDPTQTWARPNPPDVPSVELSTVAAPAGPPGN